MTRQELNDKLELAGITKKELCEIVGLNYPTVNNWGAPTVPVPKWVESWLDNYIKAKSYEDIKERIFEIEAHKKNSV